MDKIIRDLKISILIILISALGFSQSKDDSLSIEIACKNYLEGWYSGDASRMEEALHNDLVKRRKVELKETGADLINQATANDMIEYTKAKFGLKNNENNHIDFKIFDIYKDISTVKTVTDEHIDYIHLVKFNGKWKIINVLWEVRK